MPPAVSGPHSTLTLTQTDTYFHVPHGRLKLRTHQRNTLLS